jgi:hypothetical protein
MRDRGPTSSTQTQLRGQQALALLPTLPTMSENYGSYQTEIYGKGALMGIAPKVTTDPRLLEEQAQKALGVNAFNYVAGGAGEKATMDANRLAFRQWKMYVL